MRLGDTTKLKIWLENPTLRKDQCISTTYNKELESLTCFPNFVGCKKKAGCNANDSVHSDVTANNSL
jgi:hypothetical protein